MAKLTVIGCGGAGTNIAADIQKHLKPLSSDFIKPIYTCIDTTDKTIIHYPGLKDSFVKIVSTRQDMGEIDGVSGERKNIAVVKEIEKNIVKFVSTLSLTKEDFVIIVGSVSGGSGSTIAPILYKYLREKDTTVIPVLVADTSTYLHATNSINTIVSFNKLAKLTKTANAVMYFNNSVNGVTSPASEAQVNEGIIRFVKMVSMYLSGKLGDIDTTDMANFFIPSRYKTFSVQPGLYTLSAAVGTLEDGNAIIARTLITDGDEKIDIRVPLLHNKVGVVTDNHIEEFGDNMFPLFFYLQKNVLNNIVEQLAAEQKKLETMKQIDNSTLDMLENSIEDDDSGLIL